MVFIAVCSLDFRHHVLYGRVELGVNGSYIGSRFERKGGGAEIGGFGVFGLGCQTL